MFSQHKKISISFCGCAQENTMLKKAWRWMWHSAPTFSKEYLLSIAKWKDFVNQLLNSFEAPVTSAG